MKLDDIWLYVAEFIWEYQPLLISAAICVIVGVILGMLFDKL